jgi:tRNA dimethylallyltransferase
MTEMSIILYKVRDHLASAKRPLLVVLGPTASGKTAASIELAHTINGWGRGMTEIVNADSRQLYRHLNIGTAKVTAEEMRGVPHHLLDVLDPKEENTAAAYQSLAQSMIDTILDRGNIPMLVGGSMLYISAMIDGLAFPPASSREIRDRLSEEYDKDAGETLHARLTSIDPVTAAAIPLQNKPYLIRALELHESTGTIPSSLRQKSSVPYDLFVIGIDRPRQELTERINRRTRQLLEHGWIDEVRSLLERGYTSDDPGMKSHGYREVMAYLSGGKTDIDALAELISAKTRQYAKRQRTWWRGDERIQWVNEGNL